MRLSFLGLIVLLMVNACSISTHENATAPKLQYDIKSYKLTSSPDCEADSACAVFEVSYPVFSGIDSTVAKKIQREIELSFSLGDPEAQDKTLEQEAAEFIQSYKSFTSEVTGMNQGWYFNGEAKVMVLLDTLVSISIDEEYYSGGAHGGGGKYFININPRTGSEVELSDILKAGFEVHLNKVGEAVFRREKNLKSSDNLQENGFEFPENVFKLNKNYGFRPDAIIFFFNNYEIGPYAAGTTEILIPYNEILDWLITNPIQRQAFSEHHSQL
jgi:hypothetical protein